MDPLLVLVSPCFRKNVVVTCKIGSILCGLDNILQKNVLFSFWKSNFKIGLIWKRVIFDLLFTFFGHREKLQKFLQHLSHSHTCILLTLLTFCLTNFEGKKNRFYQVCFLFGVIPGVDSYSRHFGTTNKKQNGKQNLSWNVYYWYVFALMPIYSHL